MFKLPDFFFFNSSKEVFPLDPGKRGLLLNPLYGTYPAAPPTCAHGGVYRTKGTCTPKAHAPSFIPHSKYLGSQGSQIKQPQAYFQNLCNTASQGPSTRSSTAAREFTPQLGTGWVVYTIGREVHISAYRKKPGMGTKGDGLRLRTRACLLMPPFSNIDHQGGQEF